MLKHRKVSKQKEKVDEYFKGFKIIKEKKKKFMNLRRGPILFLSAGGGGNVKVSQGFPGRRVYPVL